MFRIISSWHGLFTKCNEPLTRSPIRKRQPRREKSVDGSYVTEAEKEDARNEGERQERRRVRRQREERAPGWHCSRWGPTLTLAFTPTSSILYRPHSYFRQCQPGVAKIFRVIVACTSRAYKTTRAEKEEKKKKKFITRNTTVCNSTLCNVTHSSPVRFLQLLRAMSRVDHAKPWKNWARHLFRTMICE